jgi:hypothetical protein
MSEKYTEQRIIMLFSDYKSLLRVNGISWIAYDNPKVAISHITESLKPNALRKRIKDDLSFSHTALKKLFLCFMQHVIARAALYADYEDSDPYHSQLVRPPLIRHWRRGTRSPILGL